MKASKLVPNQQTVFNALTGRYKGAEKNAIGYYELTCNFTNNFLFSTRLHINNVKIGTVEKNQTS